MTKFQLLLNKLGPLLVQFDRHVQKIAEIVHELLVLDPKQAKVELAKRGLDPVTVNRLNAVAMGFTEARLLLHNTPTAYSIERYLKREEQRRILDHGVDVVVGGTVKAPKYEHRAFAELTSRQGRQIVDKANRCLRSVEAQARFRLAVVPRKDKRAYTVNGNTITFNSVSLLRKVLRFLQPQ